MRLEDLALGYISGIDRELVVLQGISAQITRARQPSSPAPRPKRQQPSIPGAHPAPPPEPIAHADAWRPISARPAARRRRSSQGGSLAPPPVPQHLLLAHNSALQTRPLAACVPLPMPVPPPLPSMQRVASVPLQGIASPPMSPGAAPNPARFSDAHIEYIGRDCVIHNGAEMVDVAMEYAVRRAAPRLVNISFKA